jgi:hypothetical protein
MTWGGTKKKFREIVTLETGDSDGDFGKYFHLPVSVNFGK